MPFPSFAVVACCRMQLSCCLVIFINYFYSDSIPVCGHTVVECIYEVSPQKAKVLKAWSPTGGTV
jgi:hypothetical protein